MVKKKPAAKDLTGNALRARQLATQLAIRIVEQVRTQKLRVGAHLTERGLAVSLRVSRTPTRAALKFLEKMGVVAQSPHRGYFLKKSGDHLKPAAPLHKEDEHYLQIAEDRLEGRLPSRITEAELMRQYGISRIRLMAILTRMMHEGWLERLPGKGWEFLPILASSQVHEKGYRFRMMIEPAALLEPDYKVDRDVFDALRSQQKALLEGRILAYSRVELFEINSSFHEAIVAGSGNPFLIDAIRRVNKLRRLVDYRSNLDRVRMISQSKEHLQLLDLIESGDRKKAASYLCQHLETASKLKMGNETALAGD